MKKSTNDIGANGEAYATRWLESKGYRIVARNYFARVGEIDIVAYTRDGALSFIEVKTRKKRTGEAEHAHTHAKQQKNMKAAQVYCREHAIDVDNTQIRFEHISVYTHELDCVIELYTV